ALSGASTAMLLGAGPVGAIVGGVAGIVGGLLGQADRAREMARRWADARRAFDDALEQWTESFDRSMTDVDRTLREQQRRFEELARQALSPDVLGIDPSSIGGRAALAGISAAFEEFMRDGELTAAEMQQLIALLERLGLSSASAAAVVEAYTRAVEAAREAQRELNARMLEDLDVR